MPEGTALAPVLFDFYLYDIFRVPLNSTPFTLADVTVIVCSVMDYNIATLKVHNDINKSVMCYQK